MSIKVENLSKFYGEQKALDDVSFEIADSGVIGFLGPNGAGKSTLMKILTTYLSPTEGQAWVCGMNVQEQPKEVQKRIGYLPENNPLYTDMYVKEYLSFHASIHKVSKDRIMEVIEVTGLTEESHKKIKQLSKGYKQRVGLASALLHDPEVLILDEPTTGLDPNQLVDIRNLISTLGETKTVFLSTHIMQEVEAMCDRVIIINKGQLVADTTLAELSQGQQQTLVVEFDYRVEEAFLNKITDVSSVKNLHDFIYEIQFSTDEDRRPAIFDFAKDNELKILELHQKNNKLEDLFRDLTSQSKNINLPV